MFNVVKRDERHIPTLFMYSKSDSLLCPKSMGQFAESRRARGFPIDIVSYDNCDHVSIYLKYPDDYVTRIQRHLERSNVDIKSVLNHSTNSTTSNITH